MGNTTQKTYKGNLNKNCLLIFVQRLRELQEMEKPKVRSYIIEIID
jgi:hypothetical protein